jgi:DNA-binding CsgD family transcriptional regulator
MLGSLLRHVVRRRREERRAQERLKILTGRERQIFELVASGLDKYGIAETLFISPETARTHIHNVLTKLGLHSQVDLLALASQCGFAIGRTHD